MPCLDIAACIRDTSADRRRGDAEESAGRSCRQAAERGVLGYLVITSKSDCLTGVSGKYCRAAARYYTAASQHSHGRGAFPREAPSCVSLSMSQGACTTFPLAYTTIQTTGHSCREYQPPHSRPGLISVYAGFGKSQGGRI